MELGYGLDARHFGLSLPRKGLSLPRIDFSRITHCALRFTLHVLLCVSVMLFASTAYADSEAWAQEMALANRAYEEGDFAAAAARYENIIAAGVVDGRVYYNLGNAYFKRDELGLAIVNYERARRLMPRDEDVAANLAFANEQIVDRVEMPPQSALEHAVAVWQSLFTVNEMTWLATAVYSLMSLFALGAIFWPRRRRELLYVVGVVALLLVVALTSLAFRIRGAAVSEGVVTVSAVDVLSGPGEGYTTEFTVHEGTKLTIEEQRDGWWRVRLVGDLQGWVQASAVTEL